MIEHRIAGKPMETTSTEVILPMESALYFLNSATGELKWRTYISVFSSEDFGVGSSSGSSSRGATGGMGGSKTSGSSMSSSQSNSSESVEESCLLFRHTEKPLIYLINPNGLMAYDKATGKQAWKKFRKAKINSKPILTPEGIIVCTDKIYLYDYATGEIKYSKPAKLGGEVEFFNFVDDGIVLGIHKLDRKQQSYYEINLLDPKTGQLKFEEAFEVNGLLTEMWPCSKGVFYTSDRALGV